MKLEDLLHAARELPMKPGVYIMLDKSGEVIYVGKAKALRNRVSSYFHEGSHVNGKTAHLVSRVDRFDFIVCQSEFDALVTENTLIKQHRPRYNILLKDDKGYPYVAADMRLDYPRWEVVGKPSEDGRSYIGPYYSRTTLFQALSAIRQTLKLPACSRVFPREIGRTRPCINKQIGLCEGWCSGAPTQAEYRARIEHAMLILDGRISDAAKSVEDQMFEAADAELFELAAQLRDRLKALTMLTKSELPTPGSSADTDAIGFYRGEAKSAFVVMCYSGSKKIGKYYVIIDNPLEDDSEALSELLRQYYMRRGACPNTLLLPYQLADADELSRLFSEEFGHTTHLLAPRKGDKHKLVKLAYDNAFEEAVRAATRQERESKTLLWLEERLNLAKLPARIESFDISHTAGDEVVGCMVVFKDARPLKRAYKRFKIKTVEGNNDYHSMKEVLTRRIQRFSDGDEKFSPLPDLILLDGGGTLAAMGTELLRAMLSAQNHPAETIGDAEALIEIEDEFGGIRNSVQVSSDIPRVFGMVKDDRHRTRALVDWRNNEIAISARPDVFSFIGKIQEETHRFAVEYHRLLRDKSVTHSVLDDIPGVGSTRKDRLFKHFKSVGAIKDAPVEELSKIVPRNVAEKIKEELNK
ncbi:MAG: excinuclease ABC subunit UvrC [Oscillospiraceae bacterium]|jgi:excinuclease ABC subunit C|nr:excinuclease ABC subunit UvrC [Oscillospiraceae bacterium]